ncbi:MAG: response regulator [Deltaproteobacteria bacterium]|nr:response regulator [Deltaproteobacteria bacterium]
MQSLLLHSQKMEAIGTLAGGVAHDINNLLQVIMGNSQMLELKEGRNERAGEMIREIIGAAEQSAILVRQLLLFSRKQEMQFRRVDINKTVRDMMKMLGRVIGENIKVTLDLEDLLRQVMADAGSMEQVLMNLVLNSRDAMPERGAIRISTKNVRFEEGKSLYPGAQPGDFICLSVEDSGCGMSSDTIQRIFEPFFTTKPAGKGSGLGLSVVYGIVQKHGGWINVYSEQGHGTTFRIYIPTMKPGAGNGAAEETPAWSLAGQGENLLLVEDDAGVRSFTKAALRENGYNVRDAANAEEAIEIFSRSAGEIQCVITDVVLPGLSGLEMLEEMRAVRPDIRALFISGYIPNGDKWASMKERGAVMMPKPFSLGQLLSSVREVIHGGKGGI